MKKIFSNPIGMVMLCLFSLSACKKSLNPPATTPPVTIQNDSSQTDDYTGVPYPEHPSLNCQYAPNYGDSIVYPMPPPGNDYFILPKNNKGLTGTYLSWPAGISMDPKTGSINLTRSQTGQRYSLAFVLSGSTDTCMSSLIIAGASYIDSVYVLATSDTSADPYFNANPNAPQPCQGSQGPGCYFDWNGFAHDQGIEIDSKKGFIDLQKTMQNNPFGPSPVNGTTIFTTVYYALNDNSNYAHQEIELELMYYAHKSDIPKDVMAKVSNNELNTFSNQLLTKGPATRPPLIIIVRYN